MGGFQVMGCWNNKHLKEGLARKEFKIKKVIKEQVMTIADLRFFEKIFQNFLSVEPG